MTKVGVLVHHHLTERVWIAVFSSRSRVQWGFESSQSYYLPRCIGCFAEPFAAELGLWVNHSIDNTCIESWVPVHKAKVKAGVQILIEFFFEECELLALWAPELGVLLSLVHWYIIKSWIAMQKDWIAIFKVEVTGINTFMLPFQPCTWAPLNDSVHLCLSNARAEKQNCLIQFCQSKLYVSNE